MKHPINWAWPMVMALCWGGHECAAVCKDSIPLIGSWCVVRSTLKNGLKVLLSEDHSSATFAYQTWMSVGSRNEIPGKTGLAHFFEHLMFKETAAPGPVGAERLRPEERLFTRRLEMNGAQGVNAFTTTDHTVYVQELPQGKLSIVASSEADRMMHLIINEQSFASEREVVQNERRFRNENNPEGLIHQALHELAFEQHPYHWPVIGYAEDLERMIVEDARSFYETHYRPQNATVVIVGDLDPDETLSTIKHLYGSLSPKTQPSAGISPPAPEPKITQVRRKELKLNIQAEKLALGYIVPAARDTNSPILELIVQLLSGGNSARLDRTLLDGGLASNVWISYHPGVDPSLLSITVDLQKGANARQTETLILDQIKTLERGAITDQELARAKNKLNYSLYRALESQEHRALWLGFQESVLGGFEEGLVQHRRTQTLSSQDVKRVLLRIFNENSRVVVTASPKGKRS